MSGIVKLILARGFQSRGSIQALMVRSLVTSPSNTAPTPGLAAESQQSQPIKSIKEMPAPPHWPLLGVLPGFMFDQFTGELKGNKIHEYFLKLHKTYGPVFRMENPVNPSMVVVTRPEDCETMVRATMDNPIRDGFTSLKKIREDTLDDYFEGKSGILAENGEEWWRVRSRVQTPMMKAKNVNSFITPMDEVTLEFTDRMAELQKLHGEMPSNFQTELYKWALESVGLVALNRRLGCLAPNLTEESGPMKLINLVNSIFSLLNSVEMENPLWKIFPTKPFRELKKKHYEFLRIADENIQETEASLMAKKQDSDEELTLMESLLTNPGLSRKDVVTLILDMLFAGIDTTSHTMGFTLYLLARNPAAQVKLQEEVDRVLTDYHGPLTAHHLAQLSYLKAVIKESLRLYPLTTGMARTLDSDLVLHGYLIPKGWMIFSFNMATVMDESVFPRAKEFLPERWLRHRPLGPIHPYASLPFGAGTRMCIGRRIAEQEMYIFLTRVMQRFSVDYKYDDMDMISRLVSTPSQPLRFHLTERC
ncbi:hypothetical protein Pmani_011567 [Petrolisthes manimaculis]|uniref:Cytochrome P450 n=1 Tax=Petrolisthes manimaculis TaxID=1843537 RepID=A0AAE1UFJ7_9EUCA|nr:hypothetical protein Pmani_011567 [Petrolisthes manimaculis]